MTSMSDQAIALVCGAMVERSLERNILGRMVKLKRSERLELFEGLAPLSSFAAKIKIARALNIVGPNVVKELQAIKDIRNQFAHSFHSIYFRQRIIAEECRKLKTPERANDMGIHPKSMNPWPPKDPRTRFGASCWIIWMSLGGRKGREPRPKRARDLFTRSILC